MLPLLRQDCKQVSMILLTPHSTFVFFSFKYFLTRIDELYLQLKNKLKTKLAKKRGRK